MLECQWAGCHVLWGSGMKVTKQQRNHSQLAGRAQREAGRSLSLWERPRPSSLCRAGDNGPGQRWRSGVGQVSLQKHSFRALDTCCKGQYVASACRVPSGEGPWHQLSPRPASPRDVRGRGHGGLSTGETRTRAAWARTVCPDLGK